MHFNGKWLLPVAQMLAGMRKFAERETYCLHFYATFAQAVRASSAALQASQLTQLRAVLMSEVTKLSQPPPVPPGAAGDGAASDQLLTGRLRLLAALWAVLSDRHDGMTTDVSAALSSTDHVETLMDTHLFPEAHICEQLRQKPTAIFQYSVDDLQVCS